MSIRSPFRRLSRLMLAAIIASSAGASTALAQDADNVSARRFELRPFAGAYIPTGDQRDVLDDAALLGAQLGYQFHRNFAVVGTFGWAPSEDRTLLADEDLDLFQYDAGIEGRLPSVASFGTGNPWQLGLFAGLGLGGRTYNYRDLDGVDAQTNFVGYGALGLDFAPISGPLGLRVEARDYVSSFDGLRGELDDSETRNDIVLSGGVGFRF